MNRALITGIAGQDGSYLAEHLLAMDYEVAGIIRQNPGFVTNLAGVRDRIQFFYGDMRDQISLETALRKFMPDEVYNLAAQVFVPLSWTNPAETMDVNAGGLARLLTAVERACPHAKVYQASTTEMFGQAKGIMHEGTPMEPNSPYGAAKLAAHRLVDVYRRRGMFVAAGILGNHESPRRGREMVTRKITYHVAGWAIGGQRKLELGNVDASRDWGFAGDYVRAMHLMLQRETPKDYVIGTGVAHSVYEFLLAALNAADVDESFASLHLECGTRSQMRQNDTNVILCDASAAKEELGWTPTVCFEELVEMMVQADIMRLAGGR